MGTQVNPIDTDLISSNIKDGVDIFGVEGDFEGLTSGGNGLYIGTYGIRVDYFGGYTNRAGRALEIGDYIYFISFGGVNGGSSIGGGAIVCSKINKNTGSITFVGFSELQVSGMSINGQIKSSYIDGTNIYINVGNSFGGGGVMYFDINTLDDTITVSSGEYTSGTLDNSTSKTFGGNTYTPQALGPGANYGGSGADALISVIGLS